MSDTPERYPETPPANYSPPEKFVFSLRAGAESRADITQRIAAIEERVDRIVNSVQIEEGQLMAPILRLTQNEADLRQLGEALVRVAPMMGELARYRAQLSVFQLAEDDPNFFMWAFGDFTDETQEFDAADEPPPHFREL